MITRDFGTFASFLDYAENVAPVWTKLESNNEDMPEWSGTENFAEAITLARDGWPTGREYLATIEHNTIALPNDVAMIGAKSMDVFGAYPEIGCALSGEPECMVTIEPSPAPSPILRIGVARFNRSMTPARKIMEYGGIVVTYIDALEAAGWRCELTLSMDIKQSGSRGNSCHIGTVLKAAEDTMDRDRILFAIANPAMLRRLYFRVMETIPELEYNHSRNYGYQGKDPTKDFDIFSPAVNYDAILSDMFATIGDAITRGVPSNV